MSVNLKVPVAPVAFGRPAASTAVESPPFMKGGDYISIISAGLPNITGSTAAYLGGNKHDIGALYAADFPSDGSFSITGSTYVKQQILIDASRSSSIYGASSTVQPPALSLIPQIKF